MNDGRSIRMVCLADIRTVAVVFLRKWLHASLVQLGRIPPAYEPRVEILTSIAAQADSLDEPTKRAVRDGLREIIDDMRESLEDRRVLLHAFDFLESIGGTPPYSRAELIATLDKRESDSLAYDLAEGA